MRSASKPIMVSSASGATVWWIGGVVVGGEGVFAAADLGDRRGRIRRPCGWSSPLNIRCSKKCAMPDLPGGSSALPTLYQTMWVTIGAR